MPGYKPPLLLDSQTESFAAFKNDIGQILKEAFPEITIKLKVGEHEDIPEDTDIYITEIKMEDDSDRSFESCLEEGLTYKQGVKVKYRHSADNYRVEHSIILCEVPAMTPRGTFVVRGIERVFLHQLVQAPGISFEWEEAGVGELQLKVARIIPEGKNEPWLKFSVLDKGKNAGALVFSMRNKTKIPATLFFRACGIELDESVFASSAFEKSFKLEIEDVDDEYTNDSGQLRDAAVEKLYRYVKGLGEGAADPAAKQRAINAYFFGPEGLRIGVSGRSSFERLLGAHAESAGEDRLSLNRSDLEKLAGCLAYPEDYRDRGIFNGSYSLSERRVLRSGDYLSAALRTALARRRRHIMGGDLQRPAGISISRLGNGVYEAIVESSDGRGLRLHFRGSCADDLVFFTKSPKESLDAAVFFKACTINSEDDDVAWKEAVAKVYQYLRLDKRGGEGHLVNPKDESAMAQAIDDRLFSGTAFGIGRFGRMSFERLRDILQEEGDELDKRSPQNGDMEQDARAKALGRGDVKLIEDFFAAPQAYEERLACFSSGWPDAAACMLALEDASAKTTREVGGEFAGNDLLQIVEQCNILSGVAQKRRISYFGPGGLTSGRFNDDIRFVERSHYGRICPIETPEGQNVGVITNLAAYAEIDGYGRITTPYVEVESRGHNVRLLPAEEEDRVFIASGLETGDGRTLECGDELISCRPPRRDEGAYGQYGELRLQRVRDVQLADVSKTQMFSVSGSLIPFLEHDDAHRALMGANMQRQAVPLLYPQAPYVGTGMEGRVVAESGVIPTASFSDGVETGTVCYADANRIVYKGSGGSDYRVIALPSFEKTSKGGSMTLRPIVRSGESIVNGQVLADGYSSDGGELALGANLLAAYMCWEGYNYEDGIVLSERVLEENLLTSVHVHEFALEVRDVSVPEFSGGYIKLSERLRPGYVTEGDRVRPGDVLATKIAYIPKKKASPSDLFTRAVREAHAGMLSAETLNSWMEKPFIEVDKRLTVPDGLSGTVVGVELLSERSEPLDRGVNEVIVVRVAQTRKVEVGDKLAGRHGNKGVISKIIPTHEMPFLADGTPVDIILNPLGVPSRLNVGQLYECALGWVASWGVKAEVLRLDSTCADDEAGMAVEETDPESRFRYGAFAGPNKSGIDNRIEATNTIIRRICNEPFAPIMNSDGKVVLYDGRTGKPFSSPVAVGYAYMMKLNHMVQDKMHARSNGPRTQVELQPLKGRSRGGGQRIGDMETWALEAYGARNLLRELLTTLSDMPEREKALEERIRNRKDTANVDTSVSQDDGAVRGHAGESSLPESTLVFLAYLRALCLKPTLSNKDANQIFSVSFEAKDDDISEAAIITKSKLFDYSLRNDYEDGKPVDEGIFSETVFGNPREDRKTRREKFGYIRLARSVKHPWFSFGEGEFRQPDNIEGYGQALIEVLPVLPAEMRPLIAMDDGSYMLSDINVLYRNVLLRNEAVNALDETVLRIGIKYREKLRFADDDEFRRRVLDRLGTYVDKDGEARGKSLAIQSLSSLQLAVDQLLDNGHCSTKAVDGRGRAYESLTDKISGKQGILRKRLLGKRVDYSGRSVIAPNPNLGFDECGLPFAVAKELFKPRLVAELMEKGLDNHPLDERDAARLICRCSKAARKLVGEALERVMRESIVLLNRSPTLHRMGIQAFKPVLNSGDERVIRLHPLACSAFNADFDGDTMALFAPISDKAIEEARCLMIASVNILSPAHGKPLAAPSQDMVVGLYWKTLTKTGQKELFNEIWESCQPTAFEGHYPDEAALGAAVELLKNELAKLHCDEPDWSFEVELGVTEFLTKRDVPALTKKNASAYVSRICQAFHEAGLPVYEAAPILNRLMWLGFRYSTVSGLTVSYADTIVDDALQRELCTLNGEYDRDNVEAILKLRCETYRDELVARNAPADISLDGKPLLAIADSGARGNISHIRQVAALRGTMSGSYGEDIGTPILHSLSEGMAPLEYWLSAYGSRREVMNTALGTAKSGEFARSLVNAMQDVKIVSEDCKTEDGIDIPISKIRDLRGRYLAEDVAIGGDVLKRNSILTDKVISDIDERLRTKKKEMPPKIKIRSPFTCKAPNGVCAHCYGWDLSTLEDVKVGEAVGIVAAQSMSEPATQLTLSTFHGGGTAGDSIVQGLPSIISVLSGKGSGKPAVLAKYPSRVIAVDDLGGNGKVVTLEGNSGGFEWKRAVRVNGDCLSSDVKVGRDLKPTESLTVGSKPLDQLLMIDGRVGAGCYLVDELVDAYSIQNIDIDRRHLELVAGEMIGRFGVEHELKIKNTFSLRGEFTGHGISSGLELTPGMVIAEKRFANEGETEHVGVVKRVKLYDDRDGNAQITISKASKAICPSKSESWAKVPTVCEGEEFAKGEVIAIGDCRSGVYGVVEDVREAGEGKTEVIVSRASGYQKLPAGCELSALVRGNQLEVGQTVVGRCPIYKKEIEGTIDRISDKKDNNGRLWYSISITTSANEKRTTTVTKNYDLRVEEGQRVDDATIWAHRPIKLKVEGAYLGAKRKDGCWVILVQDHGSKAMNSITLDAALETIRVKKGDPILRGDLLTTRREYRSNCSGVVEKIARSYEGNLTIEILKENKPDEVPIERGMVVPEGVVPRRLLSEGDTMLYMLSPMRGEVTNVVKPSDESWPVIKYRGFDVRGYKSLAQRPRTGSFVAAAAYQRTREALVDAVLKRETDNLTGFKERLIFGLPATADEAHTEVSPSEARHFNEEE